MASEDSLLRFWHVDFHVKLVGERGRFLMDMFFVFCFVVVLIMFIGT